MDDSQVLVQVVPLEPDREIGWGSTRAAQLQARLGDIRSAIVAGSEAVVQSLDALPSAKDWTLGEVSASFGITLTGEAGVILSKVSAGATFEVTVVFRKPEARPT